MLSNLPRCERARLPDLASYVARLMRSKDAHAFLIIEIAHSEDFLQLSGDARGVQIDFPLMTARQRGYEQKIKEVASRAGHEVVETNGSNGARFLDIDVNGESWEVAAVCAQLLREAFSVSGDVELLLQHVGLAPFGVTAQPTAGFE